MCVSLRSIVFVSLTATLTACGGSPVETTDGGGPGSDSGPNGDCTCNVTIQEDSRELVCGEAACVGPGGDDRWVTCTASGAQIGTHLCIEDQWAATTSAPFDCDGQQTCPADTYCVLRAGPPPRRTECRPLPTGCTPPTNDDDFCDCLEPDALMAGICDGSSGTVSCDITNPRGTSITCSLD